jgi:SAM-dependent methyltransferase
VGNALSEAPAGDGRASQALAAAYDALPYGSLPFAQSHPDRLATLARLFGVTPAPLETCRVLELGCASGGNLLPMAEALPDAQFTGIDISPVQIDAGRADIAALGLTNVNLQQVDLVAFDPGEARYDYIIAHGVLSWIPEPARQRLFALCGERLAPGGVAYISYNTLPGWHTRGAIRDAMRYHVRRFSDPRLQVQQARAVIEFMAEALAGDSSGYGALVREEAARLRQQPDFYLFHDHLEVVNVAFHFDEFMEHATRHGLRYLAEADFRRMLAHDLAPAINAQLAKIAPDLLQREQFLDFLRNRTFRETLLVRREAELTRKLVPQRLRGLHLSTLARPERAHPDAKGTGSETFRMADGSALTTQRPLTKAAMMALVECSPATLAFDALCAQAARRLGNAGASDDESLALASDLLQAFAVGAIELHIVPSSFTLHPGERPRASPLARLQSARGRQVANRRHEWITLDDDCQRVLGLLDGARSSSELARDANLAERALATVLETLAHQALLLRA